MIIMHAFSSFASPLVLGCVDSCRKIEDHLVLFDGEGKILATRTALASLRNEENFFSLLSSEERAFFELHRTDFEQDRLLLMTAYGAALVLCHLFPSAGYFVAVILEGVPSFTSGFLLSNGVSEASKARLIPAAWEALEAFCFDRERRGSFDDLSQTLVDRVCRVAYFVGCHVRVQGDCSLRLSDAFGFHLPVFLSVLLVLLMRVRQESTARSADVVILERDGRLCFEISAEWVDPQSLALSFARATCERKELPFEVRRAEGVETVIFSPTVCDVSYLGLKNPFIFE